MEQDNLNLTLNTTMANRIPPQDAGSMSPHTPHTPIIPKSDLLRERLQQKASGSMSSPASSTSKTFGPSDSPHTNANISHATQASPLADNPQGGPSRTPQRSKSVSQNTPRSSSSRPTPRRATTTKHKPTAPDTKSMGSREADRHTDKLSKENFDLKLRIYLIEEHRAKQEGETESLRARVETLEAENCDLESQNSELERKMLTSVADVEDVRDAAQRWKEEHDVLREKFEELKDENAAVKKENQDLSTQLDKRDHAVDEAVTMIQHLEEQIASLQGQLAASLTTRSKGKSNLESGYYSAETDTDGGDGQSLFAPSVSSASRPSTAPRQATSHSFPTSPLGQQQGSYFDTTSPTPQPLQNPRLRPRQPSTGSLARRPTTSGGRDTTPTGGILRKASHLSHEKNNLRGLYNQSGTKTFNQRSASATPHPHPDVQFPSLHSHHSASTIHHRPQTQSSAESMVEDDRSDLVTEDGDLHTPADLHSSLYTPSTVLPQPTIASSENGDESVSIDVDPPGHWDPSKMRWPPLGTQQRGTYGPVKDMFFNREDIDEFFFPKRR